MAQMSGAQQITDPAGLELYNPRVSLCDVRCGQAVTLAVVPSRHTVELITRLPRQSDLGSLPHLPNYVLQSCMFQSGTSASTRGRLLSNPTRIEQYTSP
jgi:hypothetical protein